MPTDPARAQSVLVAAAEIHDPAARAAFLAASCGGDVDLKTRVEVLLRALEQPDSLLDTPLVIPPDSGAATLAFGPTPDTEATGSDTSDDDALTFLAPASRPDSLGRLGHYEVLQVLGKGGFGIVFRAFDDMLQRVVAVKVMAPQLAATSPARKRFLREARTSAQIRHENVVQVYEVGEHPLPYLVMEFVPGETLQQKLDRTGPLDVSEVLRIGRQVAEGLAAAHANNLIHRDIKPGNLLIEGAQQQVKITDFGLARAVDDASMTQSGFIAGTPMYMAPEQALGHKLDQRTDLFSLGSVLYQMVSGRPPFRASSTLAVLKRVAEQAPRPIQEVIPETPMWLSDIITKLHAKNPADRYQSAREVADVLAACEEQLKTHGKVTGSFRVSSGRPQRSGRWKWVAAAALLLPLIAFGVVALTRPTQPTQTADNGKTEPQGPSTAPVEKKSQTQAEDPDRVAAAYVLSIGGTVKVNGQDQEIKADAGLPRAAFQLTSVDLGNNRQVSDAGLAAFKDCRNVTHLLLYGTPVSDAGVAHFKNCTNLSQIDLNDTQVGDAGPAYFTDCKNLTHLGLAGSRAGNGSLAHIRHWKNLMFLYLHITQVSDAGLTELYDCKNLTKITVDRTRVTAKGIGELRKALPGCTIVWDGGVEPGTNPDPDRRAALNVLTRGGAVQVNDQTEFIEAVAKLPRESFQLKTVHLMGKTRVTDADLAQFKDCKHLTGLMLSGCGELSDAGMAHLADCKTLVSLGLDATMVTDKGLAHFADFTRLKYLSLSSTQVSDAGLAHFKNCKDLYILDLNVTQVRGDGLAHFKDCKGLAKLCLAHTKVTDAALAPFKDCKSLVTLYFVGTQISDEGLVQFKDCENLQQLNLSGTKVNGAALADFKALPKLEFIDLGKSQVNDEGLAHIKKCKNLTDLILANANVSDAGLIHLKDLQHLKNLDLRKTKVTAEGIQELKKTLPNCTVEWEAEVPGTVGEVAAMKMQSEWAEKLKLQMEAENKIGMKLMLIPPSGDAVPKAYYLGKYEVTQKQWRQVMGYNPSHFGAANPKLDASTANTLPVETVNWYDCVEFCNKLSEREELKPYYELTVTKRGGKDEKQIENAEVKILGGSGYHIPTDAEWDHACRAGTKTLYHCGDKDEEMLEYAWFDKNSDRRTHAVGEKKPNAFGLHDMHGNVMEWNEEMLTTNRGQERVTRGGDLFNAAGNCAVKARLQYVAAGRYENIGLRVARNP